MTSHGYLQDTIDIIISGVSLLVNLSPSIQEGHKALSANSTAIAVDSLHASTIVLNKALIGDRLVKRDCFDEFTNRIGLARADEQNPCVLMYGPRGCGKTSLVQAAMQVR